jgi:hypothetical protein
VRALAEASFGKYAFMSANMLEELRRVWISFAPDQRKVVVLFSDFAHPDLIQTLLNSKGPIVLCAEGFVDIVDFVMSSREWSAHSAVRLATSSIASLESLIDAPRVKMLLAHDKARPLEDILVELAQFYTIKCDTETLEKARTQLGFSGDAPVVFGDLIDVPVVNRFDSSGELINIGEDAGMVAAFAHDYNVVLQKTKMHAATWPNKLFLKAEPRDTMVDGPISLVGEARFLTYGPYFHLPAGLWSATVELETANCYSGNRLCIDINMGGIIAAVTTTLPVSGVFACDMQFEIRDPMIPLEVRMRLLTGSIEGELLLRRVCFKRLDENAVSEGWASPVS